MKIAAVTGLSGKTGYWFYQKLCAEAESVSGYRFRLASRSKASLDFVCSNPVSSELFIGNIADQAFCQSFCQGADVLIHIAGIRWCFPLLDIAAKSGIKRFILVHTTGMFSKYKSAAKPYIDLEKRIFTLAERNGITVTVLRPTMIYGTLEDKNVSVFIRMVDKLRFFPVINGAKYELQPVYAKDLGEAYYSVLIHEESTANKCYNLSGGAPVQLIEMLRIISRYLDKKTRFFNVPFWLAYTASCAIYTLTFARIDYREKVQRMIEPRAFDHTEASKDFGYAPRRFEDGVKQEVELYVSQKHAAAKGHAT